MKNKPHTRQQGPKARVMWVANSGTHITGSTYKPYTSAECDRFTGAFIPCSSLREARAIVKKHNAILDHAKPKE